MGSDFVNNHTSSTSNRMRLQTDERMDGQADSSKPKNFLAGVYYYNFQKISTELRDKGENAETTNG